MYHLAPQIASDGKHVVDVLAAGLTIATYTEYLPPLVTALTGVWIILRIADLGRRWYCAWKREKERQKKLFSREQRNDDDGPGAPT